MRAFLAIVARRTASAAAGSAAVAAQKALPFRTDGVPHQIWSGPSGTHLMAWSNEPAQPGRDLLTASPHGASGYSGYLHGSAPSRRELMGSFPALGGVWSLFAADRDGVSAATCASGAEVVYYAEAPGCVVLGNRALLVHLAATPAGPFPDLLGLASVFNAGYEVTDRTVFEGVRALGPAQRIDCDLDGRIVVSAASATKETATADDVAQALVASVAPLHDLAHPVRLGLTGGRDSRLLVALLTAANVPVNTHTSGVDSDPDVVVAREVAHVLGVPHKVGRPMGARIDDESIVVDVRSRVREAVVLGEGMLSAYDRVGRIDDRYNASTVPFAGSGGEILRAYYAGCPQDPDDRGSVVSYMRGRLFQAGPRMNPSLREAYQAETQGWLTAAHERGVSALEDFYVRQRTGRWTGAARSSASIGSLARRPYLDHLVVDAVRRVPLHDRMSESLNADVLQVLAPGLTGVRFAGRRWKFDEQAPTGAAARAEWDRRAPVTGSHGDQAGLNWRTDLDEVRTELADIVMGAPDSFWEIADRRKVSEFLVRTGPRTRADTMRMWHMATVADALSSRFYVGSEKFVAKAHEVVAQHPAGVAAPTSSSRLERGVRGMARTVRDRVRQ